MTLLLECKRARCKATWPAEITTPVTLDDLISGLLPILRFGCPECGGKRIVIPDLPLAPPRIVCQVTVL